MKIKKICEGVIQLQLTTKEERLYASKYGELEFNREMVLKIIDTWLDKPGTERNLKHE